VKILFIHPNMPGQYKHLCRVMAEDTNNTVVFITKPRNLNIPNVHKVEYKVPREPSPQTHRYLLGTERAILQAQEVWRTCKQLKDTEGFIPDVICAHPGWGDTLYIKDIFPHTPILSFLEFYYRAEGSDVGFDPEFPATSDDAARVRTKNITNLLSLECTDWGISPTFWQKQQHPNEFLDKISVLHDGIDVNVCKPSPDTVLKLSQEHSFKLGDPVVTYIARNFEPYRGFPTFMRAAEIIQRERPDVHIIAVGADEVSYGRKLPQGQTWRHIMMEKVKLDMSRMHFTGFLAYADLIKLFQISAAHIYLTYPFVLSWSALESMACGVAMVSSNTQPIHEVMTHGHNALLADFFSPDEVAKHVLTILDDKNGMRDMRQHARDTVVKRYALDTLLPLHIDLIKDVAARQFPPPTQSRIDALYI
jgi:glycosyltransferase involved in cell wall biosynthesis